MYFENREQAARLLARQLTEFRGTNPLVLAIPRGAVPMATLLARELQGELGVILVHKIPAPGYSEFAIGSIGLSGHVYKSLDAELLGIPNAYIDQESKRQLETLRERARSYHLESMPRSYRDRIVIIVDDGIATGSTALAAIREVKSQGPKQVVLAAAVAPPSTAAQLRSEADRVELLDEPADFMAVGQFFEDFPQVSDDEVIELLKPFERRSSASEQRETPSHS